MRTTALAALAVFGGCIDDHVTTITAEHVEGEYRFDYTGPDGSQVSDERPWTLFNSPETSPQCCFSLRRRDPDWLQLVVGNAFAEDPIPIDGICPPVVQVLLEIPGVPETENLVLDLDTANARLFVAVERSLSGACPRTTTVSDADAIVREANVTGQIKLDQLTCNNPPGATGCTRNFRGSWAIRGTDGAGTEVLIANGAFTIVDTTTVY